MNIIVVSYTFHGDSMCGYALIYGIYSIIIEKQIIYSFAKNVIIKDQYNFIVDF